MNLSQECGKNDKPFFCIITFISTNACLPQMHLVVLRIKEEVRLNYRQVEKQGYHITKS